MTTRRTSIKITPEDDAALSEMGRGISAVFHSGLAREIHEHERGKNAPHSHKPIS